MSQRVLISTFFSCASRASRSCPGRGYLLAHHDLVVGARMRPAVSRLDTPPRSSPPTTMLRPQSRSRVVEVTSRHAVLLARLLATFFLLISRGLGARPGTAGS